MFLLCAYLFDPYQFCELYLYGGVLTDTSRDVSEFSPQVEEIPSGSCAGHAIWGLTAFG